MSRLEIFRSKFNKMKKYLVFIIFVFAISLVYQAKGQQQPENPGFELWEEFGFGPDTLEPVNWNSLKTSDGGDFINSVIPVTMERSTDSHSGDYSVKLRNDTILIFVAPGTMTNGRVHATLPPTDAYVYTIDSLPEFNTPFADKPDSLTVWAKYFPTENDVAHVVAILHSDTAKIADSTFTNWIAVANMDISGQIDEWTRLSVPFVYLNNNTPEYILFAIYAGDAANALPFSILYLDDFELIYYNTSLKNIPNEDFDVHISGDELVIQLNSEFRYESSVVEIMDLSGKVLFLQNFNPELTNRIPVDLHSGIYICRIKSSSFNFSQKIVKR